MSERKTAEVKIRVRPSDKANWQLQASREEITLSELIEKSVQEHAQSRRAVRVVGPLELATSPFNVHAPVADPKPTVLEQSPVAPEAIPIVHVATPPEDVREPEQVDPVGTSDGVGAFQTCGCKPWEFCACKARS